MLFSKSAIVAFALGVTSTYAAGTVPVFVKLVGQDEGTHVDVSYDICTKVDLSGDVEAYQMVVADDGTFPTCSSYVTDDCSGPSQAPWSDGGGILQPAQYVGSLLCERSSTSTIDV